jgi:hypothetical protein
MPWITENDKEYWMPEVLPEPTEEYQQEQSEKVYLTQEGKVRRHPGWTYAENIAYVDDEYLFQNHGWRIIIDDGGIEISDDDLKNQTKNEIEDWEEVDEKTLRVTYTLTDFTAEEVAEYEEQKWIKLRDKRNGLLQETDWVLAKAYEQNLVLSIEFTSYRQELRDFPETIENILEFKIDDDTLWPTKPEVYFEV